MRTRCLPVAAVGVLLAFEVEAEFGLGEFFDFAERGAFEGGVEHYRRGRRSRRRGETGRGHEENEQGKDAHRAIC